MDTLKKILKWFAGFLSEDSGKASQKRLQALALLVVLCYKFAQGKLTSDNIDVYILITVFGYIAALLGMSYIPTRKEENKIP